MNRFLTTLAGENIRSMMRDNNLLHKILDFNQQQLFDDVRVHVAMLILYNAENPNFERYKSRDPLSSEALQKKPINDDFDYATIPSEATANKIWNFEFYGNKKLQHLEKLDTVKLSELADVRMGINTGNDKVFLVKPEKIDDRYAYIRSKITKNPINWKEPS